MLHRLAFPVMSWMLLSCLMLLSQVQGKTSLSETISLASLLRLESLMWQLGGKYTQVNCMQLFYYTVFLQAIVVEGIKVVGLSLWKDRVSHFFRML